MNSSILTRTSMATKNLGGNNECLLVRFKPSSLKDMIDNLSAAQREWVAETGFKTVLLFDINKYPQPLSYLIAKSYNPEEQQFTIGEQIIQVSENDVYAVLGLPKGELAIDHCFNKHYTDIWRSQFEETIYPHKITAAVLCDTIKSSDLVDLVFKLNFLILVTNVLIQGSRTPYLNLRVLSYHGDLDQCFKYNWCRYLINCLNESFEQWSINPSKHFFAGSVPFLLVSFLERTFVKVNTISEKIHPLQYWTTDMLESVDSKTLWACKIKQHGDNIAETSAEPSNGEACLLRGQQRAINVIRKICSDIDRDYGDNTNVENETLYKYLKESIDELDKVQKQNFRLFSIANKRYQSDDIIEMLKSRFVNLNGEALSFALEMISAKDEYGIMSGKVIEHERDVTIEKTGLNGKKWAIWEWLNSNQCDTKIVFKWNQVKCSKKELCSLNFGEIVSAGAIDSWSCLLNLKEKIKPNSLKHRMFCFLDTTGIIFNQNNGMAEENLLREFSGKIEQTLQTFNFLLSNINLVFFPICSYRHYYAVCYDISEPSLVILDNSRIVGSETIHFAEKMDILHKAFVEFLNFKQHPNASRIKWLEPERLIFPWETNYNTSDSGVFLMRHMDTFFGSRGVSSAEDFLRESHWQQYQLNKLRFEYARLIIGTSMNEERDQVFKLIDEWCKEKTI